MKKIGNSSSKYDFDPDRLEKDIENKIEVQGQFVQDLKKVLYKDYRYHDGQPLLPETKRNILIAIYTEFVEKVGGENEPIHTQN